MWAAVALFAAAVLAAQPPAVEECFVRHDFSDYHGAVNTTVRGELCTNWNSAPSGEDLAQLKRHPNLYPDGYDPSFPGLGDHNHCRHAGDDSFPCAWCFIATPPSPPPPASGRSPRHFRPRPARVWDCCDVGTPSTRCGEAGMTTAPEASSPGDVAISAARGPAVGRSAQPGPVPARVSPPSQPPPNPPPAPAGDREELYFHAPVGSMLLFAVGATCGHYANTGPEGLSEASRCLELVHPQASRAMANAAYADDIFITFDPSDGACGWCSREEALQLVPRAGTYVFRAPEHRRQAMPPLPSWAQPTMAQYRAGDATSPLPLVPPPAGGLVGSAAGDPGDEDAMTTPPGPMEADERAFFALGGPARRSGSAVHMSADGGRVCVDGARAVNLAALAVASASSYADSPTASAARLAIDGDPETAWQSALAATAHASPTGADSGLTQGAQILNLDLQQLATVASVSLLWSVHGFAAHSEVWGSADGTEWWPLTPALDVLGGGWASSPVLDNATASAVRFVRVFVDKSHGDLMAFSLAEVRVLGCPQVALPLSAFELAHEPWLHADGAGAPADLPAEAGQCTADVAVDVARSSGRAFASSYRSSWYMASAAIDASPASRWESLAPARGAQAAHDDEADHEWIAVDLRRTHEILAVDVLWDTAFASRFAIDVSGDGYEWFEVTDKGRATAPGWVSVALLPDEQAPARTRHVPAASGAAGGRRRVAAQFVRVRGMARATADGYAIRELQVRGCPVLAPLAPVPAPLVARHASDIVAAEDGLPLSPRECAHGGGMPAELVSKLQVRASATGVRTAWGVSHNAHHAVDGLPGTAWESHQTDSQRITIDLNAQCSLTEVRVLWEKHAGALEYDVRTGGAECSANMHVTASVSGGGDVGDGAGTWITTSLPPGTRARYVQLDCSARAGRSHYGVRELEVYGCCYADVASPPMSLARIAGKWAEWCTKDLGGRGEEDDGGRGLLGDSPLAWILVAVGVCFAVAGAAAIVLAGRRRKRQQEVRPRPPRLSRRSSGNSVTWADQLVHYDDDDNRSIVSMGSLSLKGGTSNWGTPPATPDRRSLGTNGDVGDVSML